MVPGQVRIGIRSKLILITDIEICVVVCVVDRPSKWRKQAISPSETSAYMRSVPMHLIGCNLITLYVLATTSTAATSHQDTQATAKPVEALRLSSDSATSGNYTKCARSRGDQDEVRFCGYANGTNSDSFSGVPTSDRVNQVNGQSNYSPLFQADALIPAYPWLEGDGVSNATAMFNRSISPVLESREVTTVPALLDTATTTAMLPDHREPAGLYAGSAGPGTTIANGAAGSNGAVTNGGYNVTSSEVINSFYFYEVSEICDLITILTKVEHTI